MLLLKLLAGGLFGRLPRLMILPITRSSAQHQKRVVILPLVINAGLAMDDETRMINAEMWQLSLMEVAAKSRGLSNLFNWN
jgi:hypothetical protein